eukprot:ctg_3694.g538
MRAQYALTTVSRSKSPVWSTVQRFQRSRVHPLAVIVVRDNNKQSPIRYAPDRWSSVPACRLRSAETRGHAARGHSGISWSVPVKVMRPDTRPQKPVGNARREQVRLHAHRRAASPAPQRRRHRLRFGVEGGGGVTAGIDRVDHRCLLFIYSAHL